MKAFLSFILSFLLSLTHCCGAPDSAGDEDRCRVVTDICIQFDSGTETLQRRYTDQHKMGKTLLYLRSLEPWDTPVIDPDTVDAPDFQILVRLSDGTTRLYRQKGYGHLQVDCGPWKQIDPEDGIRLPLLIAAVPADGQES